VFEIVVFTQIYLLKKLVSILFSILTLGYLFSCEDEKYLSSSDVKLNFSVDKFR